MSKWEGKTIMRKVKHMLFSVETISDLIKELKRGRHDLLGLIHQINLTIDCLELAKKTMLRQKKKIETLEEKEIKTIREGS